MPSAAALKWFFSGSDGGAVSDFLISSYFKSLENPADIYFGLLYFNDEPPKKSGQIPCQDGQEFSFREYFARW